MKISNLPTPPKHLWLRRPGKVQSSDKLAYSAEVASARKAGQISNFKFWCLVFGVSLIFDFCWSSVALAKEGSLNFATKEGSE